ncbi:MAG: hypothetical protein CVU64_17950 [Deltaproteobacteria bacterium HGW-Deltaproteobacteria-21]|nr:MAG: hypothetical protein CVU64_17950 [Deltaproteobacteria bacterium HGW-Deltaproteobacteria-21]
MSPCITNQRVVIDVRFSFHDIQTGPPQTTRFQRIQHCGLFNNGSSRGVDEDSAWFDDFEDLPGYQVTGFI